MTDSPVKTVGASVSRPNSSAQAAVEKGPSIVKNMAGRTANPASSCLEAFSSDLSRPYLWKPEHESTLNEEEDARDASTTRKKRTGYAMPMVIEIGDDSNMVPRVGSRWLSSMCRCVMW